MKPTVNLSHYALRTVVAQGMPSVKTVFPECIVKLETILRNNKLGYYVGVKDSNVIPLSIRQTMEDHGYLIHTVDVMASGGRAIDVSLVNPITGRYMSGSSSGTALNVFMNVNDLGIGTDGGGSVLAPALALNLYGFISPLLETSSLATHRKTSTDGIEFSPSLGFISKRLDLIRDATRIVIALDQAAKLKVRFAPSLKTLHLPLQAMIETIMSFAATDTLLKYDGLDRLALMADLGTVDFDQEILIACEGPIDILGYGDSVMGHYDDTTKNIQSLGHKYYLKVANMMGLSALIVPTNHCSMGYLIICKSDPAYIERAFQLAALIPFQRSHLEESYFNCIKDYIKE